MQVFRIVVSLVLATMAVASPSPDPQTPDCVPSGDVCAVADHLCCSGNCRGHSGGLVGVSASLLSFADVEHLFSHVGMRLSFDLLSERCVVAAKRRLSFNIHVCQKACSFAQERGVAQRFECLECLSDINTWPSAVRSVSNTFPLRSIPKFT